VPPLLERRAASWLSDGRRTLPVFLAVDDDDDDEVVVEAAGAGAGVSVEFELIVVNARGASRSPNKTIGFDQSF
jgi:hypothetical protein